jgi:hypothetical protein
VVYLSFQLLTKFKTAKGLFGKSSTKFSFSFSFSQKYQIKNILTFLHFLHHINNFLLLFNQKNSLQNKTFSLFYKTFSNFLSHQSFLTTIQINISIHNHLPNKPFKVSLSLFTLLHRRPRSLCKSSFIDFFYILFW